MDISQEFGLTNEIFYKETFAALLLTRNDKTYANPIKVFEPGLETYSCVTSIYSK